MKRRLVITPEAEEDAGDAAIWYELRAKGFGDMFTEAVQRKLDEIAENPQLFAPSSYGVRKAVLRQFPYSIHYLFEDEIVIVLGVLHQKLSLVHLLKRLKRWRQN